MAHQELRRRITEMLGIPETRLPLEPEFRGRRVLEDLVIEKWIWTSELGSRVPSVLYLPIDCGTRVPAMVLTFGHGGSKSSWQYQYMGQVYGKLGIACLAIDPIGEEERHREWGLGTRAHDAKDVAERADAAGRLIMGKLVFDTMRAIDFMLTRPDIDSSRIGIGGNSLGGATAGWVLAVEPRIRTALVSGWGFDDDLLHRTKHCTDTPNVRFREFADWPELLALAAPDCSVLVLNGEADTVIDKGNGRTWEGTRRAVTEAARLSEARGTPGESSCWFEPAGGHRPYPVYVAALEWLHRQLGTPRMSLSEIQSLPLVNAGTWCDEKGLELEALYGIPLHWRGASLPDLGVVPQRPEQLRCLELGEKGKPEYTIEGWLERIESVR